MTESKRRSWRDMAREAAGAVAWEQASEKWLRVRGLGIGTRKREVEMLLKQDPPPRVHPAIANMPDGELTDRVRRSSCGRRTTCRIRRSRTT